MTDPHDPSRLKALLFDKDGTLLGFQATWGGWGRALVVHLAGDDLALRHTLAEAIRIDLATATFYPDSAFIAGTEAEAVSQLLPHLPGWNAADLIQELARLAADVDPAEAVPLAPLLGQLRAAGYKLGVATNDGAAAATAQLDRLGILGQFDLVLGYDSGHGAKPGPGPCLAFAEAMHLAPDQVAMIGDSTHDLIAGRAAGMTTVGVLTGPAQQADLAPFANLVLPDIGHLPQWLGLG